MDEIASQQHRELIGKLDEQTTVDRQRLQVESERLEVEKQRLEIEKSRQVNAGSLVHEPVNQEKNTGNVVVERNVSRKRQSPQLQKAFDWLGVNNHEELTTREIADRAGVSHPTVVRALQALRNEQE